MLGNNDRVKLLLKKKDLTDIMVDVGGTWSNHINFLLALTASDEKRDHLLFNIVGTGSIHENASNIHKQINTNFDELINQINRIEVLEKVSPSELQSLFESVDQGVALIQSMSESLKKYLNLVVGKSKLLLQEKLKE